MRPKDFANSQAETSERTNKAAPVLIRALVVRATFSQQSQSVINEHAGRNV